jgi:hypothetical protein
MAHESHPRTSDSRNGLLSRKSVALFRAGQVRRAVARSESQRETARRR